MAYTINLFPQREQSLLDRIIFFSFHYLRYILVITQLVVIGVFMYRFSIDQEIVDLKDTLRQKQEIVLVSTPLLNQVEQVDKKTQNIMTLLDEQKAYVGMFNYILQHFPATATTQTLKIDSKGVELEGIALDPLIIQAFYNKLKSDQKFKTVELSSLRKTEEGFAFKLVLGDYRSQ